MKDIYNKAHSFTMTMEGGFANHPHDSGGMTYKGITKRWAPNWVGWKVIERALAEHPDLAIPYKKPPVTLRAFNAELETNEFLQGKVSEFYYERYFKPVGGDVLPDALACVMFDASVLTGVKRSVKNLQKSLVLHYGLSITIDGIFGNNTNNAVKEAIRAEGLNSLVKSVILEYGDTLKESAKVNNNRTFLLGWMERIFKLHSFVRAIK